MIGVCVVVVQVAVGWLGWPQLAHILAQLLGLPSLEC